MKELNNPHMLGIFLNKRIFISDSKSQMFLRKLQSEWLSLNPKLGI